MCTYPDKSVYAARKLGCKCARCREYDRLRQQRLFLNPDYRARQNYNQRVRRKLPEVQDKMRAYNAFRRAKYSTGIKLLTSEEKKRTDQIYKQARELTQATGIKHHVDHIIPLSQGGTHHPDNLQVLTEQENTQKGIKIMFADKERIDQALRSIVNQYGRVLEALGTGNTAFLRTKPSKPTLWD